MALGNVSGIVLKHSMLLNDVPTPAELNPGELALNANSGSMGLYALDETGKVQKIGTVGGPGSVASGPISSGATAPANPVAGILWVDTSSDPPDLKVYTAAGSWHTLAIPDGLTVTEDTQNRLQVGRVDVGTF